MKTYLLEANGEIWKPKLHKNQRGYYREEIESILKEHKNLNVICIEDELEKYGLDGSAYNFYGLYEEVFRYKLWNDAYQDKNIKGFSLPITVNTNDEYRKTLGNTLSEYIDHLNRPAFVYDKKTLEFIKNECKLILEIIDNLINGNDQCASKMIENLLSPFKEEPFFISELDKSYSFRGLAPFCELQRKRDGIFSEMMDKELTFYRVRTKKECDKEHIIDKEHMFHLPYNLRDKAGSMRFSVAGLPGLYLGTTTYMCSKECKWNGTDKLYASVFVPNSIGKKLKILNLTISQALINGVYNKICCNYTIRRKIQNAMLKIFPLVIATSFSVNSDEKVKYQYLLSQALMREANKNGIDGISYLSMKGENEFQYPQGVNLAIPAVDISEKNNYSEKCTGFSVSKPVMYAGQVGKKEASYINHIYKKQDSNGIESYLAKLNMDGKKEFYGDTVWGKFDDFLVEKLCAENE